MMTEGIELPPGVVMQTIDSYCVHTDMGNVHITTPLDEMRIAAIFRGGGPKCMSPVVRTPMESFDGTLLKLACHHGANHIPERVTKLSWNHGLPEVVSASGRRQVYDLMIGAVGVNGTGLKLFENLETGYRPPSESKTFIADFYLGDEAVMAHVGNTMHVFLLNIAGIRQAAIIPKGPYVTVCYVAEEVTNALTEQFFAHPEVKGCFPLDWIRPGGREACMCIPSTNVLAPVNYYSDRVVMVGDCGVARLFKNGIGSAYITAKACATTVVLQGFAKTHFDHYFQPICRDITQDNRIGLFVLSMFAYARKNPAICYAIMETAAKEQSMDGSRRIMSMTLWDSFSGNASYIQVLLRALFSIDFLARFTWAWLKGVFGAKYVGANSKQVMSC
ncbi:MAG: hypothetical protein H7839_23645 [Magnetococcus sp. YQC-5]